MRHANKVIHAAIGLGIFCLVTGRASADTQAYWQNPDWQQKLGAAIGDGVQAAESTGPVQGFAPATAVVEFDYQDGKLLNAKIVKSTGFDFVDKIAIDGLTGTVAPKPAVSGTVPPHHFQTELEIDPDEDHFRAYLNGQIGDLLHLPAGKYPSKRYMVYADADYLNGKFVDIKVSGAPGSDELQALISDALTAMTLPPPAPGLQDQKLAFQLNLCVGPSLVDCLHNANGAHANAHGVTIAVTP